MPPLSLILTLYHALSYQFICELMLPHYNLLRLRRSYGYFTDGNTEERGPVICDLGYLSGAKPGSKPRRLALWTLFLWRSEPMNTGCFHFGPSFLAVWIDFIH